jgi:hypothetical protein
MFQLISSDKLVIGKKYMFTLSEGEHTGFYKGPMDETFLRFVNIHDVIENTEVFRFYPLYLTSRHRYYEFISEQPQWNMERRAVNRIVRRLIGDDCFEW